LRKLPPLGSGASGVVLRHDFIAPAVDLAHTSQRALLPPRRDAALNQNE
jgi:hypothetical protein